MGRYDASEKWLERALKTVPLGSQTFSKSRTQYPVGVSPLFVARAKGSRVWDVDGNEYIDFVNALGAVTLGHGDMDVTAAVRRQLEDGTIFSLPHRLEAMVSEKIAEMVPSAQMTRFGKNGSDATAAAIRLARAATGRERVAVCGYHGWQDWYIGATARHRGVPKAVRELTHVFRYNDLGSLQEVFKAHPGEVAAVMMEPMNAVDPAPGFLAGVQAAARAAGAVFILDETITGFRFAPGGAQALFGVTPDLSTFGKGLANGYPLSAVVGRRDLMTLFEELFFSTTFGGETLSLAASLATLTKISGGPVLETLAARGRAVMDGVRRLIEENHLGAALSISGHPSWSFLTFKDAGSVTSWQVKTLFLQEVFARGILTLGTHNMSLAHDEGDVRRLLDVYAEVFPLLRRGVEGGELKALLRCAPLEPLFKLR